MKAHNVRKVSFNTMQIIAFSFLGVILLGGFLLWLPISNHTPIAFADALFTSVSAVCVTGLVTITPALQFTVIGKGILFVLIQIGGLGVIACTVAFFLIIKKRITILSFIVILFFIIRKNATVHAITPRPPICISTNRIPFPITVNCCAGVIVTSPVTHTADTDVNNASAKAIGV